MLTYINTLGFVSLPCLDRRCLAEGKEKMHSLEAMPWTMENQKTKTGQMFFKAHWFGRGKAIQGLLYFYFTLCEQKKPAGNDT